MAQTIFVGRRAAFMFEVDTVPRVNDELNLRSLQTSTLRTGLHRVTYVDPNYRRGTEICARIEVEWIGTLRPDLPSHTIAPVL